MGTLTPLYSTPRHVAQLFNRAMALDENEKTAGLARELYREVVRIAPDHWEAHNNLGVLAYRAKDPGAALDHWRDALDIEPLSAATLNNVGSMFYDERKYELAVVYLEDSIRINPEQKEARQNLALALERVGQRAAARRQWRSFLRRFPWGDDAEFARERLQKLAG
ncbi:MAG TPA: tetratricopeptide repeat protein [Polyangiaceae bacterium]|nr:tetratricopeptide repeat protein [Polyangiaceae bacterium]HWP06551.1 tetratricopeptide repeat protein [Polyangiaceae bacterium]